MCCQHFRRVARGKFCRPPHRECAANFIVAAHHGGRKRDVKNADG
jgi:hypothetical protein